MYNEIIEILTSLKHDVLPYIAESASHKTYHSSSGRNGDGENVYAYAYCPTSVGALLVGNKSITRLM